jgi:hypothetical protein
VVRAEFGRQPERRDLQDRSSVLKAAQGTLGLSEHGFGVRHIRENDESLRGVVLQTGCPRR